MTSINKLNPTGNTKIRLPGSIQNLEKNIDKFSKLRDKYITKYANQKPRTFISSADIVRYVGFAAILTFIFVTLILAVILFSKSSIAAWVVSALFRSEITFSKVLAVKILVPILSGGSAGLAVTSFTIPMIFLRKHLIKKEKNSKEKLFKSTKDYFDYKEEPLVNNATKDIKILNLQELKIFLQEFKQRIEKLTYASYQKKIFEAVYTCLEAKIKEDNNFKDIKDKYKKLKEKIDKKFPDRTKEENAHYLENEYENGDIEFREITCPGISDGSLKKFIERFITITEDIEHAEEFITMVDNTEKLK